MVVVKKRFYWKQETISCLLTQLQNDTVSNNERSLYTFAQNINGICPLHRVYRIGPIDGNQKRQRRFGLKLKFQQGARDPPQLRSWSPYFSLAVQRQQYTCAFINMHAAQNGNNCVTSCLQFENLNRHFFPLKCSLQIWDSSIVTPRSFVIQVTMSMCNLIIIIKTFSLRF